ncbi:phenylacetate--CoA ligase family protein [Leifsonia sp. 22587]|uniref:phenylacetate--CoA ligase family protein n=1 Tax=Leifsonia sp. 22587 TaxID=3453946 RepID=UPI003F8627A7
MTFRRLVFDMKRDLFLRDNRAMYERLLHDQRLEPEELAALQARRAIDHARFAYENTRFYRDLYTDAGITADDLRDPAAFTSLPIVQKSDVRAHFDDIRSTEATAENSVVSTSGGSTGEPLKLLRDLRTPTRTIEWRLFSWWGVHPSDNVALVSRQVKNKSQTRKHDLQWWPSKRIQLDAYRMDENSVSAFISRWEDVKPEVLIGYVGGIVELASFLERSGIAFHPPKAIAVTAAPITPAQRALVERTFGAPVYDHYRCAEIPWMAGECAQADGMHVFADVRVIEVLDDSNRQVVPGQLGETVATDLTNRVFPLIRYRLGDRTTTIAGRCACGVTLPRIANVSGRVSEALHLPDGRVVAGEGLTQLFSNAIDEVRQFQVHQLSDYSIVVRCVPAPDEYAVSAIEHSVDRIRDIVQGTVPVRLELVTSIPHDGGKIRYIRSDVPA